MSPGFRRTVLEAVTYSIKQLDLHISLVTFQKQSFSRGKLLICPQWIPQTKKECASSVNRTRASSMATTNSTTRPMMLVDMIWRTIMQHVIFLFIPPIHSLESTGSLTSLVSRAPTVAKMAAVSASGIPPNAT